MPCPSVYVDNPRVDRRPRAGGRRATLSFCSGVSLLPGILRLRGWHEARPAGRLALVQACQGAPDTAGGVGAGEPGAGDVAGGGWPLVAEVVGVGVPLGRG